MVEGVGAQFILSSIPSGAVRDMKWPRKTQVMNKWQRGWCCHRKFGFVNPGAIYLALGLMVADGRHFSLRGKQILAQELAGLIERVLN